MFDEICYEVTYNDFNNMKYAMCNHTPKCKRKRKHNYLMPVYMKNMLLMLIIIR